MKKIGMFTRYTALGASSRYRFYKYVMELIRDGFDVQVSPFFSDAYLQKLYDKGISSRFEALKSYIKRFVDLRRSGRNLIIEYELLPFVPYFIERWFLRGKCYILNFDDNVWEKYTKIWFLRRKYSLLVKHAAGVIVANDYLKKRVRKLNNNVIKIPTALDPDPYCYNAEKYSKFTLVWIGTPITYKYLQAFAPMLRRLADEIDYNLLVIARRELHKQAIEGVNMTFVDWSEDTETFFIPRAHVGIMPLTKDKFSQGKSSFKILQYFASGIPAVVSPVGENKKVVKDGANGFLVDTEEEWLGRIKELYNDRKKLDTMSDVAIKSVWEYSLEYWTPELIKFIERSLKA
eukprot:TRINITY_DN12125_c0_g1_i2.p3 TRINITY_DN12125_c0_g1~~TRINITY_DN12125_c0_g1_i2.p3  ORF type:complete len:347 (+),score=72.93 TRINITY_DN12125_c0_g1_i2:625-1665(+)